MRKESRRYQMLVSARIGGAERLAMQIHQYLAAQSAGVSELLIPAAGDAESIAIAQAMPFRTYDLHGLMNRNWWASLSANVDLFRKLRLDSKSIIHVHSPFVFGALRPLLAVCPVRVILHLHLDYSVQQLAWPLKHAPDLIMVCAEFMKERVAGFYAECAGRVPRITVAINAVDTTHFHPGDKRATKESLGIAQNRPMFLMAANLAVHKGQETAIKAASIIKAAGHNPLIWFVGEEREDRGFEQHLRQLADRLCVADSVQFLGYRRDIAGLMRAADFLLLPSTQEGLPLSILEAQASKAIVLAAPTAGIPEVVEDGRTGMLIAADDARGYAAAAIALLEDPSRAAVIAGAAHKQVLARSSLPTYMQRIDAEYQAIMSEF
jgi:glycosyltransferase involved in cell wall biosynthesis